MTITSFDKPTVNKIGSQIEEELQALATELGVSIKRGCGTYTDGVFTLKIEVATLGEGGVVNSREAEAFKQQASYYGLTADHLGAEFTNREGTFVVSGLKPRSTKFPILAAKKGTDKTYKFPARAVRLGLGVNAPEADERDRWL